MEMTEEQLPVEIKSYESVFAGPFDCGGLDHERSLAES